MEKDLVEYAYLSDNLRYADLFNGVLFGGEEVIDHYGLTEGDTRQVISSGGRKKGRYRDVIRKYGGDVRYAVLGVENQEIVDYTMPIRIMEYEVGEYSKQIAAIRKTYERCGGVSGDEYLCKFKKGDKLNPCITLVLYWGEGWDGPCSLKEMLGMEELPENLREYVNDYPIHFVSVREFEDTSVFKTDLRLVFDFMKCTKDRKRMQALLSENGAYKRVAQETYEVIRIHANLKELDEVIKKNQTEEKGVWICVRQSEKC